MRDTEGIFLGNHLCARYGGLSSYSKKKCCGIREIKIAKSVCLLKGIIEAELVCNARCDDFIPKLG